ncbi:MAG TPA: phosphatase PAP2 family protein [Methyloceanibacter sp.]|nr:phosphatase PAP2 family protein [Methyloceanibacter sp.]
MTQDNGGSATKTGALVAWAWRNRLELWLLGGLFLAGLLILAFGQIAEEVLEGDATWFDRELLLALRNPVDHADPLGLAWLEEAARDITALGSYSVLGIVVTAVIAYLLLIRREGAALWVLASVVGGALLSNVLKHSFDRPRPDLVAHAAKVFSPSFPSGHATLSAVTFLTLGALLASLHDSRRLKVFFLGIAIVITVMVGVTRVYLGVHYPTDVLAGWCIGAGWAAICWTVFHWLQRRGTLKPAARDALDEGDRTNGS